MNQARSFALTIVLFVAATFPATVLAGAGGEIGAFSSNPGPSPLHPSAVPLMATVRMPVKNVTVFKDGHTLIVHEGEMETDPAGDIVMNELPAPVLGTFWAHSADQRAKLTAVLAGKQPVEVERTALNLRDLLEANVGAEGIVTEVSNPHPYPATIVGFPSRKMAELQATDPPGSDPRPSERGSLVLLKTYDGLKALPVDRIQDVTFKGSPRATIKNEEFRNLLRLKLDWGKGERGKKARVSLAYVQRGLRWIPSYKVDIDGRGHAKVYLQAALINELTDLSDVSMHLVVGVPTFAFQDTPDPISFMRAFAQVDAQTRGQQAFNFSNAIMTQTQQIESAYIPPAESGGAGRMDLGPEIATDTREDLFVFTLQHVTLKKGQRVIMPIAEYEMNYQDIYALDIPFSPPPELRGNVNSEQQARLARLFYAPKVMHRIRITNSSKHPLTTAPALIVKGEDVLAQGLMTYTAAGGSVDLDVMPAVDLQGKKTDKETNRVPNALHWQNSAFARVELAGVIHLVNYRDKPVELEVTRGVLGAVGQVDRDGEAEKMNTLEDPRPVANPYWWSWYNWPYWWSNVNSFSRITWKVKLAPGEKVDLNYTWSYFWQ